jgi:hypothetical protein
MDERKTVQEWADLDGIEIWDPDGFDRSDPDLWERKVTKEEYLAGISYCTVCMKNPYSKQIDDEYMAHMNIYCL